MAGETVLVIDDEIDICNLIELYLVKNNINVVTANSGTEALNALSSHKPDLIVLDVLLPDTDGFELCKELRKRTTSPILFLSCKNDDIDKILGLTVGGDDYISKPFSPSVLVARIKAHLRRNQMVSAVSEPSDSTLNFPGLTIDLDSHTVYVNGKPVFLPLKEFSLLVLLAQNPNKVFSLAQLYDTVWGIDNIGDTRTVMVHMSNLRKKIEKNPTKPKYIITIKGVGYKLNA